MPAETHVCTICFTPWRYKSTSTSTGLACSAGCRFANKAFTEMEIATIAVLWDEGYLAADIVVALGGDQVHSVSGVTTVARRLRDAGYLHGRYNNGQRMTIETTAPIKLSPEALELAAGLPRPPRRKSRASRAVSAMWPSGTAVRRYMAPGPTTPWEEACFAALENT